MMDYEIRFQKLFPIVISKRYVYFYWRAILLLCDKENAINQKGDLFTHSTHNDLYIFFDHNIASKPK